MKISINQQIINLPIIAADPKDRTRPSLQYVSFENGKAVATDGHKLSAIPCGPDKPASFGQWLRMLEAGEIGMRFLARWKPFNLKKNEYATLDTEAKEIVVTKWGHEGQPVKKVLVEFAKTDIVYPAWQKILPKEKPVYRVAFDLSNLVDLAKTLGSDKVVLELSENGEHVINVSNVTEFGASKTQALIMPLRVRHAKTQEKEVMGLVKAKEQPQETFAINN